MFDALKKPVTICASRSVCARWCWHLKRQCVGTGGEAGGRAVAHRLSAKLAISSLGACVESGGLFLCPQLASLPVSLSATLLSCPTCLFKPVGLKLAASAQLPSFHFDA